MARYIAREFLASMKIQGLKVPLEVFVVRCFQQDCQEVNFLAWQVILLATQRTPELTGCFHIGSLGKVKSIAEFALFLSSVPSFQLQKCFYCFSIPTLLEVSLHFPIYFPMFFVCKVVAPPQLYLKTTASTTQLSSKSY